MVTKTTKQKSKGRKTISLNLRHPQILRKSVQTTSNKKSCKIYELFDITRVQSQKAHHKRLRKLSKIRKHDRLSSGKLLSNDRFDSSVAS